MAVGEPPPRLPPHEVTENHPFSLVVGSLHIQNSFVQPNNNTIKPQKIDTSTTKSTYADILLGASTKQLEDKVHNSGLIKASSPDGVCQGRVKLKPITKYLGKPAVIFSNSDKISLIQGLKYVLVAKFSHGKPSLNTVKEFFANFNLKSRCNISVYDSKHLFLECETFDDFVKIWMCKNCMVGGFLMRIFKWREDFHPSFESPICPVWVHLPGLPLYLYHEESLMSIANAIGRPLALDLDNINRSKLGCATFCVEVDISLEAIDKIWIAFDKVGPCVGKKGIWQKVIYDPLPPYCNRCAHLGHAIDRCLRMDNLVHKVARGDIVEGGGMSEGDLGSGGLQGLQGLQGKGVQLKQALSAKNHEQNAVLDQSDSAKFSQKSGAKPVTESGAGNARETRDRSCVPVETVHTRIRTDLKDQERKSALYEGVLIEDITLEEEEIDVEAVGATAVKADVAPVVDYNPAESRMPAVEKHVAARDHLVRELAIGKANAGDGTQEKAAGKHLAIALELPGNKKGKLCTRQLARKLNANKTLFKKPLYSGTRDAASGMELQVLSNPGKLFHTGVHAKGPSGVAGIAGGARELDTDFPAAGKIHPAAETSYAAVVSAGQIGEPGSGQNLEQDVMNGRVVHNERIEQAGFQEVAVVTPLALEEGEIDRDGHDKEVQEHTHGLVNCLKQLNENILDHAREVGDVVHMDEKITVTPRKLSSAAAEFTPKCASALVEIGVEEKSATDGGQMVMITKNDMEQLQERMNRLRGNSFPAAPSLAASTWVPPNMSKHLARELKKARKQHRINQNWQDIEDYSDEESDEGDLEEKAGSQMMNGKAFLTDEMGDIPRPFKIKSAPNSPKGRNSSYDSSTYLLSRGLF